jgi:hypothetical protein
MVNKKIIFVLLILTIMALGQTLGGIAGGIGGTLLGIPPPVGAAIGGGLGGLIDAGVSQGKANNAPLPLEDFRQTQLLADLARKRRALESGAAYQPQQDTLRQAGLQTQENIKGVTGGDVGATVGALMGVNRGTGRGLNELYGSMSMEGLKMSDLMKEMTENIAKRRLEIQAYQKAQLMTQAGQQQQDATSQLYGAAARMGESDWIKDLFKQNTPAQPNVPMLSQQTQPMIGNTIPIANYNNGMAQAGIGFKF